MDVFHYLSEGWTNLFESITPNNFLGDFPSDSFQILMLSMRNSRNRISLKQIQQWHQQLLPNVLIDPRSKFRRPLHIHPWVDITLLSLSKLPRTPLVRGGKTDNRFQFSNWVVATLKGIGVNQTELLCHYYSSAACLRFSFVLVLGKLLKLNL